MEERRSSLFFVVFLSQRHLGVGRSNPSSRAASRAGHYSACPAAGAAAEPEEARSSCPAVAAPQRLPIANDECAAAVVDAAPHRPRAPAQPVRPTPTPSPPPSPDPCGLTLSCPCRRRRHRPAALRAPPSALIPHTALFCVRCPLRSPRVRAGTGARTPAPPPTRWATRRPSAHRQ